MTDDRIEQPAQDADAPEEGTVGVDAGLEEFAESVAADPEPSTDFPDADITITAAATPAAPVADPAPVDHDSVPPESAPEEPAGVPELSDVTEPAETAEPGDATAPTDTTEPADATGPGDATEPAETADPANTTGPTDATEPGDVTEPTNATAPTNTTEPADATDPGDVTEPTNTTEPASVDAPADTAEPDHTAARADAATSTSPTELAPSPTAEPALTSPTEPTSISPTEPVDAADSRIETTAVPRNPAGPRTGPRPVPGRPGPAGRPGHGSPRPRPAAAVAPPAGAGSAPTVVEPAVEPVDPHLWGRIDAEGVVYVRTASGERAIGSWQAGDAEAGLAHFGLRFDDFICEVALLEARLASGSGDPRQTKQQAIALRESVETLAAIGDLDSAAARLETVIGAADTAIAGASAARAKARADAVAAKEALCAEAEALAASTQWKTAGDRFKTIVDEWRAIKGIDRKTDDALWKRFARARDTFTRNRGSHFAELDKQRGAAREAKEKLIKRADELSASSEWGETAAAYRELMTEWKSAGRAPREVEDELWERFRAAQEKFFARRNQTFAARDAEFEANAAAKEKLLAEAKSIDPDTDLDAAKAALRSIQERWEAIGKVPRERMRELDGRLKAIEDRVRAATDAQWRRTDPATAARVEQFRARAQSFRDQAARARAAGDERRAAEAEEQAATWEQWLATAQSSAQR